MRLKRAQQSRGHSPSRVLSRAGIAEVLLAEEGRVVELGLIGQDVRVCVGSDREVALADALSDPGLRHAAEVQERDPAVPEVVRRERRDAGRCARMVGRARMKHSKSAVLPHHDERRPAPGARCKQGGRRSIRARGGHYLE